MGASPHELPRWECIDLLESQEIGRVCIVEHSYPLAFPVNYRVTTGPDLPTIVFRTSPSAAIGTYTGQASFEIDVVDAARRNAWSVIARGTLRRGDERHWLVSPTPLVSEGRIQWMALTISSISGRRFVSKPVDDGAFAVEWESAAL